jgi:hypothetical protein
MTSSTQTLYDRLFSPGRPRIFIFLAIVTLPAGCVCIFIGYPIIMAIKSEAGCSKSYIYEQQVNITPLVNLNIPADMHMAQWEDPASNVISTAPYVRVKIEVTVPDLVNRV